MFIRVNSKCGELRGLWSAQLCCKMVRRWFIDEIGHRLIYKAHRVQKTLTYRNLAMDFRWPFRIATGITIILAEYLCGFPQLQAYVRLEP